MRLGILLTTCEIRGESDIIGSKKPVILINIFSSVEVNQAISELEREGLNHLHHAAFGYFTLNNCFVIYFLDPPLPREPYGKA